MQSECIPFGRIAFQGVGEQFPTVEGVIAP